MSNKSAAAPDSTAVRVALWRALHMAIDAPPYVFEDDVGLRLADPGDDWRSRPDMDPRFTRSFRTAIIARARFIDDLVADEAARGLTQYVILGAGLDSFAQRLPDIASRLRIFEVDRPGLQAWKQQRLIALGYGIPEWLRFVPVDFEGQSWWQQLLAAGFDPAKPAAVASTGVSLYLTKEANFATLRQIADLASGSTLALSFILPPEHADPEERPGFEAAIKGAKASGTPFVSFFTPDEITAMARQAGFKDVTCVTGADLAQRYFAGRSDGLRPSNSEALLVART